jgi:transcriptional regulator with XRE-family HTH domain
MERGRTLPSLATLYKLAAAYNMTASDLLRGVVLREEAGRDNE